MKFKARHATRPGRAIVHTVTSLRQSSKAVLRSLVRVDRVLGRARAQAHAHAPPPMDIQRNTTFDSSRVNSLGKIESGGTPATVTPSQL